MKISNNRENIGKKRGRLQPLKYCLQLGIHHRNIEEMVFHSKSNTCIYKLQQYHRHVAQALDVVSI